MAFSSTYGFREADKRFSVWQMRIESLQGITLRAKTQGMATFEHAKAAA